MKTTAIALAVGLAVAGPLLAEEPRESDPRAWFSGEHATARLMILGTFHFKDAGLDSYKPEVDVDIMSAERQAELAELHDRLARYRPTKILIEVDVERQGVFDERYRSFVDGSYELGANEVYQVGFRLAQRLEHERLYAVDASGRRYENLPDLETFAREHGLAERLESPWDERYTELYRYGDHIKAERTLIEHLLYLNSEERIRWGHGHYLLRKLGIAADGDYPAADHLTGWWYNRNLRIFANVMKVMEPGDRLLLLIGAGHLSILRHAAQASPEIELVEVGEYLR